MGPCRWTIQCIPSPRSVLEAIEAPEATPADLANAYQSRPIRRWSRTANATHTAARIFDLAALYQVGAAPHGPSDVSPITLAVSLQLGLATPNFAIQEFMGYEPIVDEVFEHAYSYADGYLHPGDAAGLGVQLNEELAARYPYSPAYLPVARRRDGTMTDW